MANENAARWVCGFKAAAIGPASLHVVCRTYQFAYLVLLISILVAWCHLKNGRAEGQAVASKAPQHPCYQATLHSEMGKDPKKVLRAALGWYSEQEQDIHS